MADTAKREGKEQACTWLLRAAIEVHGYEVECRQADPDSLEQPDAAPAGDSRATGSISPAIGKLLDWLV